MTAPMPLPLPYGIRDCKLTPYVDSGGEVLGTESFDLPNMQTFSFSEKEEFQELRGDDKLVTTHGKGAQVDWSLEAGGISMKCWSIFSGGEVLETGTSPTRVVTVRKRGSDIRPFFRVEGQSVSDSGGDVHAVVYRCRCNDQIQGEFKDGEFYVTKASGLGLPLLDDTNDLLYDFVQNESKTAIPLTPIPNPRPTPQNITVGALTSTTVALDWDDTVGATAYQVQKSVTPFSAWTDVLTGAGGVPTPSNTTVTGLTTATQYKFRVKATFATAPTSSDPSLDTGIVTTP